MKFITINDEFQIRSLFPETIALETVRITHGIVLESFEDCFVILIMGDQGGSLHWSVTFSQIDGPQSTESGTLNCRGFSGMEQASRLETAINGALDQFTKDWLPIYRPTN